MTYSLPHGARFHVFAAAFADRIHGRRQFSLDFFLSFLDHWPLQRNAILAEMSDG